MNATELLHTIAVVSAWARADAEAIEVLTRDSGQELYSHLMELILLVIQQNTEGNASLYLEFLADQARQIQAAEASQ